MAKSIYVPQAGGLVHFDDSATDQQMLDYIDTKWPAQPAPKPQNPADQYSTAGLGATFAYGAGSGYTDIPGGISSIVTSNKNVATDASDAAKQFLQQKLGIDPEKKFTTAQWIAYLGGQLAGFAIPLGGEAKAIGMIGKAGELAKATEAAVGAAKLASAAGKVDEAAKFGKLAEQGLAAQKSLATTTKAAELGTGAVMGGAQQANARRETIEQQRASGMNITPEQQLLAQRLDFLVGTTMALPAERMLGPLEHILGKIPVEKAPIVEKILNNRAAEMAKSGTALAAQQAGSGIISDLVESKVYNPDVKVGQDVLSQAAAGGVTGVLTTGIIQALAHRKLAPIRQADQQIRSEGVEGAQQNQQGKITQAVEGLKQAQAQGVLNIVQSPDGLSYHIVGKNGQVLSSLPDPAMADAAVSQYKSATGAKVDVGIKPSSEPDVVEHGMDFGAPKVDAPKAPAEIPGVGTPSFKTDSGSLYVAHDNGATTHLPVPVKGETPNPVRLDKTVYADPKELNKLSLMKADNLPGTPTVAEYRPNVYGIKYLDGPAAGKFVKDTFVNTSDNPEKGKAPIGLSEDGKNVHFGDQISEVYAKPEPKVAAEAPQEDPFNVQEAVYPTEKPVEAPPAPAPIDYTPEYKARLQAVSDATTSRLAAIGLKDVVLRLKSVIEGDTSGAIKGQAYTDPDGKRIIELAHGIYDPKLTTEQLTQKVVDTLNHEVIHSLVSLGVLKPSEFKMLRKAVETTKVPGRKYTYLDKAKQLYTPEHLGEAFKSYEGKPDAIHEEAIADMFKDWKRDSKNAPPQVRGLFNRVIEMFKRMFGGMKRAKHEDLFKQIDSGEVGARERKPIEVPAKIEATPEVPTRAEIPDISDPRYSFTPSLSEAPLSPYLEQRNKDIFHTAKPMTWPEAFLKYTFGELPKKGDMWTPIRMALEDKDFGLKLQDQRAFEKAFGKPGDLSAEMSSYESKANYRVAAERTIAFAEQGGIEVVEHEKGNFQSATLKISPHAESIKKVWELLYDGPPGPDGKPTSLMDNFKSYAYAKRTINLDDRGIPTAIKDDPRYLKDALEIEHKYPQVKQAYDMYQRVNKRMLEAAYAAGRISKEDLAYYTKFMDYYGFYHQLEEGVAAPSSGGGAGKGSRIISIKGTTKGDLVANPIEVMLHNANFWVSATLKNIASRKAFMVAKDLGEAKQITASDVGHLDSEWQPSTMKMYIDGSEHLYAVKDPYFVQAMTDERIDMPRMIKLLSLPSGWLRTSVTHNPIYMVMNMSRDALQTWVVGGMTHYNPILGVVKGFYSALTKSSSYVALVGHGVIGGEVKSRGARKMAEEIKRANTPTNVLDVAHPGNLLRVVHRLWDGLQSMAEASESAGRIAIYDHYMKTGASSEEAARAARAIMDFSKHGSSEVLNVATKLIPFLHGRVVGMGPVWDAGKAGYKVLTGGKQSEKQAYLGKQMLLRGGLMAAASIALESLASQDPEYKNLDQYYKDSNFLFPLIYFGLPGKFISISKPFESGIFWSTLPQHIWNRSVNGEGSFRNDASLFYSQFSGTFGVNPIPQALAPIASVALNRNFFTGNPLIDAGKERLAPQLQYNSGTSALARIIAKLPIGYNFSSGKFDELSPINIDALIQGYGGPWAGYITAALGSTMAQAQVGPSQLPTPFSNYPGVRQIFIDASAKNPAAANDAYELYRMVDETGRTLARLKQMGAVEEYQNYLSQNKDLVAYKGYITSVYNSLNQIKAQERRLEVNTTMSREEKLAALAALREQQIRVTKGLAEIDKKLGR